MRSASLAHTVVVVQSATKKDVKPQLSAVGQAYLDHLLGAAHQRRARTGPCGPASSLAEGFAGSSDCARRADTGRHEPWPC